MENASKALIIAGAILLAILLISLGIMIFNQASSTLEGGGGMDDAQKSTFNAKFQKYESESAGIKGSMVKALINEIKAVNSDDNDENNIKVKLKGTDVVTLSNDGKIATDTLNTSGINTNTTYLVQLGYSGGRINEVTITVKP